MIYTILQVEIDDVDGWCPFEITLENQLSDGFRFFFDKVRIAKFEDEQDMIITPCGEHVIIEILNVNETFEDGQEIVKTVVNEDDNNFYKIPYDEFENIAGYSACKLTEFLNKDEISRLFDAYIRARKYNEFHVDGEQDE